MKKQIIILVLVLLLSNMLSAQDVIWKNSTFYDYVTRSIVETDGENNVYAAFSEMEDFYINKFDAEGNFLWMKTDTAVKGLGDMLIGDNGTLYFCGSKNNPPNDFDCYLGVYSSNGIFQYEGNYSISNISKEAPDILMLDESGNVYIAGFALVDTVFNIFTLKMNPGGSISWAQFFNLGLDDYLQTRSMCMNNEGDVYVNIIQAITSDSVNTVIIKYTNEGQHLYTKQYVLDGYPFTIASDIVLDQEQNLIFVGMSETSYGAHHGHLAKLDPEGEIIWQKTFNPVSQTMPLYSAVADNDNNIYIAGLMKVNNNNDAYYAKISPDGDVIWENLYSGMADSPDVFAKLILSGQYCYWAGSTRGTSTGTDILVLKTDLLGNTEWVTMYDGEGHGTDIYGDFILDNDDNVIVSGITEEEANFNDYGTVVKYSNSLDIDENNALSNTHIPVVYPNPVGNELCFRHETTTNHLSYKILDISGKTVKEGSVIHAADYIIGVEDLKPGLYFLTITDANKSALAKFLKD